MRPEFDQSISVMDSVHGQIVFRKDGTYEEANTFYATERITGKDVQYEDRWYGTYKLRGAEIEFLDTSQTVDTASGMLLGKQVHVTRMRGTWVYQKR